MWECFSFILTGRLNKLFVWKGNCLSATITITQKIYKCGYELKIANILLRSGLLLIQALIALYFAILLHCSFKLRLYHELPIVLFGWHTLFRCHAFVLARWKQFAVHICTSLDKSFSIWSSSIPCLLLDACRRTR